MERTFILDIYDNQSGKDQKTSFSSALSTNLSVRSVESSVLHALDRICHIGHIKYEVWRIVIAAEFGEWFDVMDSDAQIDIREKIRVLEAVGPALGRPLVDTIKESRHSNMKELRVQSKGRPLRIFFAFDPKRTAVLLIGGDKTGDNRFYKKMIPKADKIFDEYLEGLE